jgi:hypothetical protein
VAHPKDLAPRGVRGIYYRPRAAYSMSIYVKDDPGGGQKWRLGKVQPMRMENISPVIALGVDRALFAARQCSRSTEP